jgi:hypothetical protein
MRPYLEDKTAVKQMRLIQQLDEHDKQTIFKLIDKMLINKKFKDFFQKNVATLQLCEKFLLGPFIRFYDG